MLIKVELQVYIQYNSVVQHSHDGKGVARVAVTNVRKVDLGGCHVFSVQ
jgi:hypothetical protein